MATTIADIRARFPQYSDLSDEELASGLHKKFYSDMPAETFYSKIGFSKVNAAGARIDEAIPDYGLKSGLKATVGAVEAATGIASGVAGDIAGAATSIATQDPKKGASVRDAMAYQPRTEAGKALTEYAGALTEPVTNVLQKPVRALEAHGHPILAQTLQAAEDVLPLKVPKVVRAGARAAREAVRPAAEAIATAGEAKAARRAGEVAERNQLVGDLRKLGIKLTSQDVGAPVGRRLEAAASRPELERELSYQNDTAAKKALGADVGITEPVSKDVVDRAITETLVPYRAPRGLGRINLEADQQWKTAVKGIEQTTAQEKLDFPDDTIKAVDDEVKKFNVPSADADSLTNKIVKLRERASANFRAGGADNLALARAQKSIANAMEEAIERHGASPQVGKAGVIRDFRAARTRLAKLYTLRDMLTPAGHLDLRVLEKELEDEPKRLTGNFRTIAQGKKAFDRSFQNPENIRAHPLGFGDLALGALAKAGRAATAGAATGGMVAGHPGAVAGAVAAASRPLTRAVLGSAPYQRAFIRPRVPQPSLAARTARAIAGPKAATPRPTLTLKGTGGKPPGGPSTLGGAPTPKAPAPKPTSAAAPKSATKAPAQEPRNPINPRATAKEKLVQLKMLTAQNKPIIDRIVEDLNSRLQGSKSLSHVKSDESSLGKASRPSILANKPWFGVDYLRDHLRFKTSIDSLDQLDKIPEVFAEHGVRVVKIDTEKMLQPNAWGWRMAALDLQMPNGQLVEHYAVLRELEQAQRATGHRIYEEGRWLDENVPKDRERVLALRQRSRALYQDAWRAGLARAGVDESAVRASVDSFKAKAASLTKTASGSVNVPRGILSDQAPPTERTAPKPSAPSTATVPSAERVTSSGREDVRLSSTKSILPNRNLTVTTSAGRQFQVRPKIVEAADLVASDSDKYPQELQPRQRGSRVSSQEQVRDIASKLDPVRLGISPKANRGAPIIGEGGVVESGNGRVFALREVYKNNPGKAEDYRQWLQDQGYDVKGFKQPVLVVERTTPMSMEERRAFTVEANQSGMSAMSPVERAKADSRLLDTGMLSQLQEGELASAKNAPFVRSFLNKVPQGERNALVNPDGSVSQEGVRRIQSAVLAKAYGGTSGSDKVLGRMLESTDTDMRSALGAMLDAAPAMADLREAIREGKVDKAYDLAPKITRAIETVAQVRERGQAISEFLKQQDLVSQRDPVVDELIRSFYKGNRLASREQVAALLRGYAQGALKQRLDQASLFGGEQPKPEQLLSSVPRQEPQAGSMSLGF